MFQKHPMYFAPSIANSMVNKIWKKAWQFQKHPDELRLIEMQQTSSNSNNLCANTKWHRWPVVNPHQVNIIFQKVFSDEHPMWITQQR